MQSLFLVHPLLLEGFYMITIEKKIYSEKKLIESGKDFSASIKLGDIISVEGELGVGKTTFTKGILFGLGYQGLVQSPTFSIIKTYFFEYFKVHHIDLYRINDDELTNIWIDDYLSTNDVCIIEWFHRGGKVLPSPNRTVNIKYTDTATMRFVSFQST